VSNENNGHKELGKKLTDLV